MNTDSPSAPTQPKERKSSRVATISRKQTEAREKLHDAELDETLETLQSEEISQESSQTASSSETSSEADKKKTKKKS